MRRGFIGGNWKMNKVLQEAKETVENLNKSLIFSRGIDIVIFPPYTLLFFLKDLIDLPNIYLGAQNMHWEENGAFTGEISPLMLKDLGVEYVIIGHSERRTLFGETDEIINKKLISALKHGLKPVLCLGESVEERKKDMEKEVIERQFKQDLRRVPINFLENIVIAYEPVWAIGTGLNATPNEAEEMHKFIRTLVEKYANDNIVEKIRIIYGGSVRVENVEELSLKEDIDGFLIGGASLRADSFSKIIEIFNEVKGF
ncbi:MAG TPA: triose-phosphate isomerase [Caldisericia bacterium]|nr:triose-phosphate isomerase [Caldisericia bacterium]